MIWVILGLSLLNWSVGALAGWLYGDSHARLRQHDESSADRAEITRLRAQVAAIIGRE